MELYAAIHPRAATRRSAAESRIHTTLLAAAAVIVGSFVIAVLLVASLMLAGPLPAHQDAAPMPQMLPQPSAAAGLDR